MRHTEIAIVGGGLAGSTAAAMLGRAGHDIVLIDPHAPYPPDFRCEKLDLSQVALLQKTGLAAPVLGAATRDDSVSVARFGRLVERRPNAQYGILYDALVNTVRAEIPQSTAFIRGKVTGIAIGDDRQRLQVSTGEDISARLIVMANGLNVGLRNALGMSRQVISPCHSISIGFDMAPLERASFDFRAFTYYPERASDQMAYLTLFPIGPSMRANLFVYRPLDDPWLRQMRESPHTALDALVPGLRPLVGPFEITGDIKLRPVDLYVTEGHRKPGVVLIGDAFATSCPAAGTGTNKVLTDVERLCNVHVPRWLASKGMGDRKLASFYQDEVKRACDKHSLAKAFHLRTLSTSSSVGWQARRWLKFIAQSGVGRLRRLRERVLPGSDRAATAAGRTARI
jgi:2-polyprenyl-6-methoxyphenol hydroxylase-like FAD-dependent oxidoreductase